MYWVLYVFFLLFKDTFLISMFIGLFRYRLRLNLTIPQLIGPARFLKSKHTFLKILKLLSNGSVMYIYKHI